MSKELGIILKIKGLVDKTLPSSLAKIATETKNLRIEKSKLEKYKKLHEQERKLKKEILDQVRALRKNKSALKVLEQAKAKGIALSKEEQQKYRKLISEQRKLERQIKSSSSSYKKYGMELKKLKIPYDQLQKEIDQTISKMKKLDAQQRIQKSAGNLKRKYGNFSENVKSKVKTTAAVGAGALFAGGIASAKSYIEFDKGIRKVKALTGATEKEFKLLSDEALRLGKTTKFTSLEATAGMEKFALAGLRPKQIVEALPSVLDLAAASGEDFAMISDIISDHAKNFKYGTKDIGQMAGIMANTMSRANVDIEMLGETLRYVSSSANDLNIDFSTTAAVTGLMGDQALKSGQAGRNLEMALSKIATSETQKKLKAIGVSVKDSKGNFIGLADLVEKLNQKLKNTEGLDKKKFLGEVFGVQGSRAINKLLKAEKEVNGVIYKGADAIRAFAKENEKATEKAKTMKQVILEGAGGAWDLFTSSISGLKLTLGKIIFDGGGLGLLKTATNYINSLSDVISGKLDNTKANLFWQDFVKGAKTAWDGLKTIGKALVGVAKVINTIGVDNILVFMTVFSVTSKVTKFAGAIQTAITTVKAAGGVLSAMQTGIAALGGPISLIVAGLVVFSYWVYKNWDTIKQWGRNIKEVVKNVTVWLVEALIKMFLWIFEKMKWFAWNVGIYFLGPIGFVIRHWDFLKEKATKVIHKIKNLLLSIGGSIKGFFKEIFNSIPNLIDSAKNKAKDFLKSMPGGSWVLSKLEGKKKAVDGSHANGLANVPYDGYIAELHKGERVLTANENKNIYTFLKKAMSVKNINFQNIKSNTTNRNLSTVASDIIQKVISVKNTKFESIRNYPINNSLSSITNRFFENIKSNPTNRNLSTVASDIIQKVISVKNTKFESIRNYPINSSLSSITNRFFENHQNKISNIPFIDLIVKTKKFLIDGSHANGLANVPYDGYIAELHKGERVLTAEENGSLYNSLKTVTTSSNRTTTINNSNNSSNSQPKIHIEFSPKFENVNSETASGIYNFLKEEIEKLKQELETMMEREENYGRVRL
ncbi:MAG: phage tail tape measure protein [Fusobacterium sp.]|nr:phage tail tape measure protein [Fusobacterium sp.]